MNPNEDPPVEAEEQRIAELLAEYEAGGGVGIDAFRERAGDAFERLAGLAATHDLLRQASGHAVDEEESLASIGPFKDLEPIASGSYGRVYAATDPRTGKAVAVKVLHGSLHAVRGVALERFRKEARIGRELDHPNLVKVLDLGEDRGRTWLSMELLPLGSLKDLLDDLEATGARTPGPAWDAALAPVVADPPDLSGPDAPDRWARWACGRWAGVAEGLEACRQRGVVHRDVKPGNLLFGTTGELLLGDFGLAHAGSNLLTRTLEVLGTPQYMSPEQAAGGAVDARTDVYALAATLYETLSLAPVVALEGRTPSEVSLAIQRGRHRPLREVAPHVPAPVAAVVEAGLRADASDRYATPGAFAQDLRRAAAGERVHPPRIPPIRVLRRALRGRGRWIAAIAAVALASVGALRWVEARAPVTVTLASEPAGTVWIDGVERGPSPWKGKLPRGAYRVRFVREGFATMERSVEVTGAGKELQVSLFPEDTRTNLAAVLAFAEARGVRPVALRIPRLRGGGTVGRRPWEESVHVLSPVREMDAHTDTGDLTIWIHKELGWSGLRLSLRRTRDGEPVDPPILDRALAAGAGDERVSVPLADLGGGLGTGPFLLRIGREGSEATVEERFSFAPSVAPPLALEDLPTSGPDASVAPVLRGLSALERKHPANAIVELRAVLDADPGHRVASLAYLKALRDLLLGDTGFYEEALRRHRERWPADLE